MKLTDKELTHLAKLSKLNLTVNEQEKFQKWLQSIVDFLGQLNEINVSDGEGLDEERKIEVFADQESFAEPEKLIANSKHKKGDFISVKTSLKE